MLEYIICNQLNDDIRYIRETVFIKEQGFENEFDEIDSVAIHMLVKKDNKAIATARLYLENNSYHIGRIAVLKEYRALKIGSKIIKILEEEVKKSNVKRIEISSQVRTKDFYYKCGYKEVGDIYLDEGCPHVLMIKEV